ncbi:MAG: amino acid--[acyl-carrier-protein] ligase [Chloroflexi bacterium]|nr:amino acid--[acyl-carrier-protein] ligase [Chloroflexota bacterium]
MAGLLAATPDQAEFLVELLDHGLLIETGEPGVYGRGGGFERIREAFDRLVSRVAEPDGAEAMRFPPVLPRRHFEASGYLKSFPHLAGTIFSFEGTEQEAIEQEDVAHRHGDWSGYQRMTDLVLVPAACYPVYPAIARRGPLPPGGLAIDAGGAYVFRHEPSADPARLQMFHQREMVRLGEPETVALWRNSWRDRAEEVLTRVGLDAHPEVAADPFFGRAGRMLAANQRAQELKFELLIPIAGPEPTAVASFNYHQDHFAGTYGITMADGSPAHTACLGFGLERITLGLLRSHGLDHTRWPAAVTRQLWP